jgi:hypothetical protein
MVKYHPIPFELSVAIHTILGFLVTVSINISNTVPYAVPKLRKVSRKWQN